MRAHAPRPRVPQLTVDVEGQGKGLVTRTDILATGIRVVAIWLVVRGLQNLGPMIWLFSQQQASGEARLAAGVGFALPAVVGLAVWASAEGMARWLLPSPASTGPQGIDAQTLQQIVYRGIGAYLVATQVASLGSVLLSIELARTRALPPFDDERGSNLLRTAILLVMSVWLVAGAPGLQRGSKTRPIQNAEGDS